MPLLEWNSNLSVHVPHLDDQHRVIVGLVNELHGAMMQKQGRVVLRSILDRLIDYTVQHFADEEAYMRSTGFANLAEHQRYHEDLTREVRDLQRRLGNDEIRLTIDVMRFLQSWVVDHIQDQDKKYAPAPATS